MSKKKYALVTSLKTKTYKMRFRCFINIIYYSVLSLFFLITGNMVNFFKFSKKLNEVLTYRTPKNYGHGAVSASMVRGFRELNIPFTINEITKDTEIVIILATTPEELEELSMLKKAGKIKKIVTTPACSLSQQFVFELPTYDCVDMAFIASDFVKKVYQKNLNNPSEEVMKKIIPWPSGVQVSENIHKKPISKSCICYYKHLPINDELTKLVEDKGIKVYNIEYYKYRFEEYMKLLQKVDFVIYYQNYIETQGLAMAEAWAKNCPTFILYNENEYGGVTAPYLTNSTGAFYKDFSELENILDEYLSNPELFLSKFYPQEWCLNNMSDKSTVKELIKLLGE